MIAAADSATVADAGVDTWSPAWYADYDSPLVRHLRAAGNPGGGGSLVLPEPVDGHRVGWFSGSGLVFAEGHPMPGRLAAGDELPDAFTRLVATMGDRGLDMTSAEFAGVRRIDTTVDLRFTDPVAGMAVMAAVAHLQFPRLKTHVIREVGGSAVETIALRGYAGRKIVGRMYDKGIESRTMPRGHWIRPEDQRRYDKTTRLKLEAVNTEYVRTKFSQRFQPLWQRKGAVRVASPIAIARTLAQRVEAGELTMAQARRIAGYVVLESVGCSEGPERTRYRLRAEARAAGVYVDASIDAEDMIDVDVSSLLEAAFDSSTWGATG